MKYAVCNELFGNIPLREAASMIASHGFHGLELAPFTVFGDFSPEATRCGITLARQALEETGLEFAGLHWLFVKPEGLHITTPDKTLRKKSWDHLRRLVDISAELGGGNMILGSPRQRSTTPGQSREEAIAILTEEFSAIAPYTNAGKSSILIESLSSDQTDVVNLLSECQSIIQAVNHPGVDGMFDFHNCADETDPLDALINKYYAIIRHVHLNNADGGHPRPGEHGYLSSFQTLRQKKYTGWVSLEIFSIPEDASVVLSETMQYLKEIEKQMGANET